MRHRNALLAKLSGDDIDQLTPCMQCVQVEQRQILVEAGDPVQFVYFPEDCICSILAVSGTRNPIEVGMAGNEGMTNIALQGDEVSPFQVVVQRNGAAWRIAAADFATALRACPSLNEMTLRFKEALLVQFAYTALSHGTQTLEERLARWLLMYRDRTESDELPLVHDSIASMLAVRRSGGTTALAVLESTHAIKASRGMIQIRDREKLLSLASGGYGLPEAHYERLVGTH